MWHIAAIEDGAGLAGAQLLCRCPSLKAWMSRTRIANVSGMVSQYQTEMRRFFGRG
jgi:hypothetical protein